MRDSIRFLVNGREHQVRGRSVFKTLANYLREDAGATGTKVVCAEGDCGACTVLVRRRGEFLPVNSCILSLAQLDGTSIVTVEGIADGASLHPVQQSMIENFGSQCGYCTPGFVVAMADLAEHGPLDAKKVRDGLTGNLCRCTGYESIINAALKSDCSSTPRMCDRYRRLEDDGEPVLIEDGERVFFAPVSIEQAIRFKREHAQVTILNGGTDVGVWVNKRGFSAQATLSLTKIRELDDISVQDTAGQPQIVVGANVRLSSLESFIEHRIPELHRILGIFGSPQIKHAGTLAGNIANASPIADTLPYLFVAGAQLELAGTNGTRLVPIDRFYLGYKKLDLAQDEIIMRVFVPIVAAPDVLKLYKVSRRTDLDISAFTGAIRLRSVDGHIADAKIAYGGVAPVVMRMPRLESFLNGKPVSIETFEAAGAIARAEVSPISDVRGSREYRLQLCENILQKFYFDAFTEPIPWSSPGGRADGRPPNRSLGGVTT
jgi:xanthine dehydrogenase small subunit